MTSQPDSSFTLVSGDRHAEVPRTLVEPVPQPLGIIDQFGLWGNLGVSLLGFTGAIFVLQPNGGGTPELSLLAALTAILLGTVLGTLAIAFSGVAGARTGAPAMVLLRGVFGSRLSYVPTLINIVQLLGWGIFELVTIATAARTVEPGLPQWAYVLIAGVITGLLTLYPLGAIRILRRIATPAVLVVLVYLFVELLRHPMPALTTAPGPASGRRPTRSSRSRSPSPHSPPTTHATRARPARPSGAPSWATASPRCSAT